MIDIGYALQRRAIARARVEEQARRARERRRLGLLLAVFALAVVALLVSCAHAAPQPRVWLSPQIPSHGSHAVACLYDADAGELACVTAQELIDGLERRRARETGL